MRKGWLSVSKKQGTEIVAAVLGALSASALAAQTPSWTFTTLDFPGFASVNGPLSINNGGDIAGFYDDSNGALHGYVLLNGGDFTSVDFPGSIGTMAMTINDRREVVGTYWDAAGFQHGFLLKDGTFSTIDFPGAAQTTGTQFELGGGLGSTAFGINRHGDVIGEYATADRVAHAYLLRRGRFTSFDAPGSVSSATSETAAFSINSFGHIVGAVRASGYNGSRGFLLKNGQFTFIAMPEAGGGFGTTATGLNDRGDVVGSFADPGYTFHGFALIDGQYVRIDVPGARATETYRIDNYQTIVGAYVDDQRRTHGYVGVRNP